MPLYSKDKTNFIYLTKFNNNNKLFMKCFIIDNNNENLINDISNNYNNEKLKNRIILSHGVRYFNNNYGISLINQSNILNNIKLNNYFDNNGLNNNILFIKNKNNYINNTYINNFDNKYLFDNLDTYSINFNQIKNTDNTLINIELYQNLKYYIYNLNYYYQDNNFINTNYYKFKINDFIYKNLNNSNFKNDISNSDSSDISYTKFSYIIKNIDLSNDFANNSDINYNSNYFKKLYYLNVDNSINLLNLNQTIGLNKDISNLTFNITYNKINNITTLLLDILYNNQNIYLDVSINFFIIKNYNYDYILNKKSKIFFNNSYTYFKNIKVIDYNSNFYNINQNLNNKENLVYLSLGHGITGLTQHDLYNNIKIIDSNYNINKIIFSKSIISSNNIINNFKNNYYLLDQSYNYDYINILNNNIQFKNTKINNLNLLDFFNFSYNYNPYINNFNNIELLNNKNIDYFNTSYSNNFLNNLKFNIFSTNDVSYNNSNFKLKLNSTSINDLNNITYNNNYFFDTNIEYDFRFNYSQQFVINLKYNVLYELFNDLCNNTFYNFQNNIDNNALLNFYKYSLATYFNTTNQSDFTNVNCIFIYHDPEKETDPSFLFPYNNIEISNNPSIDTLSKAIELLPGAKTATTNTTFIPAKNGSNLSRKMIQGYIGFNNIPKLLSIQPYDENILIGRGFLDQFLINDKCKSNEEKIIEKFNSQKYYKNKIQNSETKKINFSNLVRTPSRNKKNNLQSNCINDPKNITKYYTPFKLYKS